MRFWLTVLYAAVWTVQGSAQDKKKAVGPIPVVTLDRKEPVSYDKDIEPILVNKCQVCHSGPVTEGKFDAGTFESLLKGGKRGKPIHPGHAAESLLIKLAGKTQKPFMPPKSEEPLAPAELALIKLWIDQGAKAPAAMRERAKVQLGSLPATVHPVRAISISPDKSVIAVGRGNEIYFYQAASGSYLRQLIDPSLITEEKRPIKIAHRSIVESLAFSPDSRLLVSGSYQEVNVWDVKTGTIQRKLTGFADRVVALSFSPNGKWLATGGGAPTQEGEIKIFEEATGKIVLDIKNGHSDTVFGVSFSPDGTKLATCGADKFVKVFEVPSGKWLKSFEGHTHHVLDVGWKADGKILASAGADNVIKVWDFTSGEQARTIAGHGKQVTRLLFIGKTAQVATCSGDKSLRIWNVDNGGNVRGFAGNTDFLYSLGVSPDGGIVATGGEEGVVRLYNGNTAQLIKVLSPPGR